MPSQDQQQRGSTRGGPHLPCLTLADLIGGSDGKSSLRDLNVLVYVTWFVPPYTGQLPPPRVGHTLR